MRVEIERIALRSEGYNDSRDIYRLNENWKCKCHDDWLDFEVREWVMAFLCKPVGDDEGRSEFHDALNKYFYDQTRYMRCNIDYKTTPVLIGALYAC